MTEGWIKLHRKFTEWEWYADPVVSRVFLHCLLSANVKPCRVAGHQLKRGEFATTYGKIAKDLKISYAQARHACERLNRTGEIVTTSKGMNFLVISVNLYDQYQVTSQPRDNLVTTSSQQNKNERIEEIYTNKVCTNSPQPTPTSPPAHTPVTASALPDRLPLDADEARKIVDAMIAAEGLAVDDNTIKRFLLYRHGDRWKKDLREWASEAAQKKALAEERKAGAAGGTGRDFDTREKEYGESLYETDFDLDNV